MERITLKNLENAIATLNRVTGSPLQPYLRDDDYKLVANVGNFHLSEAYGGYQLHRMVNKQGGITNVLRHGYVSKPVLFDLVHAYRMGFETAQIELLEVALTP